MINPLSSIFAPRKTLKSYKSDTSGNIAIMTAALGVVLVGGLALAIDVSSAHFAKERLQDTTDAIALMAAKDGLETQAELTEAANAYFNFVYPGDKGARIELIDIQREGDTVNVKARNNINAYFAPIWGKNNMNVSVTSEATYANKALDLALVLDTTGSMSGTKIANLKTAANNLVDTLGEMNNDNLRLSVIPFSQYVNVGTSRRNENWLDVPEDETRTTTRRDVVERRNCREETRTGTNDGQPVTWTANVCDTIYGPPRSVDYTVTWKGCVGSRDVPLNTQAAFNNRRIPGLLGVSCGTEIRELTNNLSQVKSTINALAARGNTYMPSGLVWGWRALDGGQPLPSRAPSGITETDRVLVLMTDGQNTKSKTGNFHNGNNSAEADNTTRTLCTNIKREDITVFTIAYDVSDNTTKSLIRQCASSNAMFFDADNAKDLDEAFQEIAENLSNLRITS